MKLLKVKHITGKIRVLTGLHIGGSQEATQIGGMDNPIIRQPKDNMPYIPGSSLKGKMRCLLELHLGKVDTKNNGKAHSFQDACADKDPCPICHIFGIAASDNAQIGPARLIVRDCLLDTEDETVKRLIDESRGFPLSEEKTEVQINRITGAAYGGSLRKTERVPAGAVFNLDMTYRVFDLGDGDGGKRDEDLFKYVKKGLALVQKDALGGSGSRGYGKIAFENLKVDGEEISLEEV